MERLLRDGVNAFKITGEAAGRVGVYGSTDGLMDQGLRP